MLIVLSRVIYLEIVTLKRGYSYASPPSSTGMSDTSSPHATYKTYAGLKLA